MTPPDTHWHAAAPPSDRPSPEAAEAEPRWPRLVLEASALLAVLCCLALAALWFVRHPVLNAFDEVGHITNTLSDALMLRRGEFTVLRDALFLWNRWLPPGLRVVGLPIAAAAGDWGAEALRLSAAAMFLLTVGALWMALRPVAGRGGAAAAVLLYALSPVNLFGAQNFMTEAVLHLCAALALWLLIAEARSPRASVVRMGLLGPVLGLGTLTKLTFLPAFGLVWAGVALHGWWRAGGTGRPSRSASCCRWRACSRWLGPTTSSTARVTSATPRRPRPGSHTPRGRRPASPSSSGPGARWWATCSARPAWSRSSRGWRRCPSRGAA
jgi:hypothetical protein